MNVLREKTTVVRTTMIFASRFDFETNVVAMCVLFKGRVVIKVIVNVNTSSPMQNYYKCSRESCSAETWSLR